MSSSSEVIVKKKKGAVLDSQEEGEPGPRDGRDESPSEESPDSESESDSSPSSEEEDSEEESVQVKKQTKIPAKKKIEKSRPSSKFTDTTKELLVKEILKRWWYAMQPWPPKDFDYEARLKARRLRLIPAQRWQKQPEQVDGMSKATPVEGHLGLYRTVAGIVDVRPRDNIPSYSRLITLPESELRALAHKAVSNQLDSLKANEKKIQRPAELKQQLERLLKVLSIK